MEIALATQADILEAIRQRVIFKCPNVFNETNVYVDDEPLPGGNSQPTWDYACSVSMTDGNFNQEAQIGGSRCQIQETSSAHVCVMQHFGEDDPERLDNAIIGQRRSMLRFYKPLLMSAILVDRLASGAKVPWIPSNQSGQSLLVDGIRIANCQGPHRHSQWPMLYMNLTFVVTWNWDL